MKPTKSKKHRWLWLIGVTGYLIALCLLTLSEQSDPNASIQSFSDAFWYSLVTMSTVGYGDLYPVTVPGRILGAVFILLSLGMLTFLFSMLIRIITGKMLPDVQLWMMRHKNWYIFSCQNDAAFTLANDLMRREPDCVVLFPECADSTPPEHLQHLVYTGSIEALAARKKDRCSICFMDDTDTYTQAVEALQTGHRVYCRTAFAPDKCPDNLTLFNPYDCCAQSYWQDHSLTPAERTVLLIGDGKYAEHLLTRGLLLNVFDSDRTVTYHVFGNWQDYLLSHYRLSETLCLNGDNPDMDCLHFHQTQWNTDSMLLASADRIILCLDDREKNVEILGQIHRYFPTNADIHLLCHTPLPFQTVFGTQDSIYTTQLVLQEQMTHAARAMHRIYCDSTGGNAPSWDELSEFLRQSNIAAAGHLLTKVRLLLDDDTISNVTPENCRAAYDRYCSCSTKQKEAFRRIEHQRWMRFHSLYNWRYAPERNNSAREHPLMLPYEKLAPSDQAKDDYAWELLDSLANNLNET